MLTAMTISLPPMPATCWPAPETPERQVELRGDDLAGGADEAVGGEPAAVGDDPGAAQRRLQRVGQLLQLRHAVRPADAEAAGDDPLGVGQVDVARIGRQGAQRAVAEQRRVEARA